MSEKMNIYQKLQICRVELQKNKMKKSGKNSYSNYDYFELGDFLPRINELMQENGLTALFFFNKEEASLKIIDTDSPENTIIFSSPVAMAQLKGCHEVQNIGATQTYMRRYLYVMAFEIAEHDAIEPMTGQKEDKLQEEENTILLDEVKIQAIKAMLKQTNSPEKEFLKFYKLEKIEDMTLEIFARAMRALEKKLEKMLKETNSDADDLPI